MIRMIFVTALLLGADFALADSSMRVYPLHLDKAYRQDYTNTVIRDSEGFLWIGTDNGLKRYDGYSLQTFSHDSQNPATIGSPNTNAFLVHSDGTLWTAGNYLNRYNAISETFTRYNVSQYKEIYSLYEDELGRIWVGGDQFGLILFNPNNGQVIRHFFNEPNSAISVQSIIRRQNSAQLWLGTSEGLWLFDTQTLQAEKWLDLPNTTGFRPFMRIQEGGDGDVWIVSREGLYRFNPATRTARPYRLEEKEHISDITTRALTSIARDQQNNIWIGSDKHGVFRYAPETDSFVHYAPSAYDKYRFPPAPITYIFDDQKGSVWFAAGHHGVFRLSPQLQKFHTFQHSFETENSLSFNQLSALYEDSKGYIWIGTDGNGVDRFDPRSQSFQNFRHSSTDPHSLSSDSILSIAEDSQGFIWLGTWAGGLNRLDPETGKVQHFLRDPKLPTNQTLAENHVFRIAVDKDNRLLLAVGSSGLQIFDPETGEFIHYPPDEQNLAHGLRSDYINDILLTPDGDIWIGGYRGLEKYSPETGKFTTANLAINGAIFDIHSDNVGLLWIATSRGLIRFNPVNSEAIRITPKDGLSDEHVMGIEQDERGYLWLATRNGLNRFDPISKEIEVFDEEDGLAGAQFNRFSHLKTRSGHLYFGTNRGFSYFDPQHIPRNEFAPSIHFTSISLNHQIQIPGQSPWLPQSLRYMDTLILPSDTDDIRLSFTATNLIAPGKNRYRYRLLGRDKDWIETTGDERTVLYSNLPAGKYQFQLIAANNDGVWAGKAKTLNIEIQPVWWQTWWAYGMYISLLVFLTYGFSVWRVRVSGKRARELEVLVNEQTTKLKIANRAVSLLNSELEQRVNQRTHELLKEIEERKESEAKATYIAYHDSLTGLYNRAWLLLQLEKTLKGGRFALLFAGGDRFRKINDTYGHQLGDQVLIAAGQRLLQLCPDTAHVTRLGSDEFAVLIENIENDNEIELLVENIIQSFRDPFLIDQVRLSFTISIGYVIAEPGDYDEPSSLLRNANIAMQKAKDRGRGVWQKFDDKILQETLSAAELETDLKMALQLKQFHVVYQPIISIDSCRIVGFEVLIRWLHPQKGMIPPDKFIAMAEASGQIFDIGLWVLEQACQQLNIWKTQHQVDPLPVISVNLSPIQLERRDFLDRIDEIIINSGVDTENIKFEITETALLQHTETVDDILESLRERKIELAIDDFGTGYSSLAYLDKLPVQVLKIDRSFINALAENKSSAHEIVRATISLAHNLNMRIIAEGIETQQQMEILKSYGCDYGQGYFIAKPLSPENATVLLLSSTGQAPTA